MSAALLANEEPLQTNAKITKNEECIMINQVQPFSASFPPSPSLVIESSSRDRRSRQLAAHRQPRERLRCLLRHPRLLLVLEYVQSLRSPIASTVLPSFQATLAITASHSSRRQARTSFDLSRPLLSQSAVPDPCTFPRSSLLLSLTTAFV